MNLGYGILNFLSSNVEELSIFVTIFAFIYINWQLYSCNRQRYYTIENNLKIFDYNLLLHMIFQSIIFGGSSFVFIGLLTFGFTGVWPKSYISQIGQGAIVFSGFAFLIFSWKYVDEFIKIKLSEKATVNENTHKQ